jgi:hypothetical protein
MLLEGSVKDSGGGSGSTPVEAIGGDCVAPFDEVLPNVSAVSLGSASLSVCTTSPCCVLLREGGSLLACVSLDGSAASLDDGAFGGSKTALHRTSFV